MREINIFNLRFLDANIHEIYNESEKGGFMIAPSAPSLSLLKNDPAYKLAMEHSKFAIFDSSFLCLCLMVLKFTRVKKISGLRFLSYFLSKAKDFKKNSVFLIDPTTIDKLKNRALLQLHGYELIDSYQYVAPIYNKGSIIDFELLKQLEKLQPTWILINLGGGVQERLAYYIQSNISFKSSILCTGAAIAFITGEQAKISNVIDRMHLGWLARCAADCKQFVPRYIKGFKVFLMLINTSIKIKNIDTKKC
jgi:UDP-N-acetyl-D-mannosaminuronic acid transferase (WecB/TagA/CpsF family)